MLEKIINGINYRLDEEDLTAEVIDMDGYKGDIIIPETVVHESVSYRVTSIGNGAFADLASLASIVIPDSVTSIVEGAFSGCESLTSITFRGAIAQWKKIELGDGWNNDIPAKVVHCTDGDVKI